MSAAKPFDELLTAFFIKYDKRQLRNVNNIAEKFRNSQDIVMEHLCKKYNVDPRTIEGLDLSAEDIKRINEDQQAVPRGVESKKGEPDTVPGEEKTEKTETAEPPKPKSKKKLFIIIIVIVIIAVIGAAAYIFKDKIIGTSSGEKETTEESAPAEDAQPQENVEVKTGEEAATTEEPVAEEAEGTGEATEEEGAGEESGKKEEAK
ncbi:MAG: hypothetical protein ABII90_04925 [Bacteroidota bacterium]